jgi:hypothetical protein
MIKKQKIVMLILFLAVMPSLFGWGGRTHRRLTYWAWKRAGLPESSGTVNVKVNWDLEDIQDELGAEGSDMMGFCVLLLGAITGADFIVADDSTIYKSVTDSALFSDWGAIPDHFDTSAETVEGANIAHMYIPGGVGFADGMCLFFFNQAVKEYKKGNKRIAYAYLAMSAHYLEDCGFPAHNEKDYFNPQADLWQAKHHHKCEDWIADSTNWMTYFDGVCEKYSKTSLPACDPRQAVHTMSWETVYDNQIFKNAWSSEAKYFSNWDTEAVWKKELLEKKPKTVKEVSQLIAKLEPRIVGLFLAFKEQACQ